MIGGAVISLDAADLFRALGLALLIEGVLFAAFPDAMRAMIAELLGAPKEALRLAALLSAVIGLALVWLAGM